jgi:hypothetical protein
MPTATRTRAPRGYRYSQLGPKGKAAAREWYRNQEWGDDDGMEDLLSNDLSDHYGLTNCEVMYSLDNCQGDGVVFKGNPDLEEWADHDETLRDLITEMKGLAALLGFEPPDIAVQINQHGHYTHWNSMDVCVEDHAWEDRPQRDLVDAKLDEILRHLEERVKNISRELEETGYAEIDYRASDEYLDELLAGNEDNDYFRWTRSGEHAGR